MSSSRSIAAMTSMTASGGIADRDASSRADACRARLRRRRPVRLLHSALSGERADRSTSCSSLWTRCCRTRSAWDATVCKRWRRSSDPHAGPREWVRSHCLLGSVRHRGRRRDHSVRRGVDAARRPPGRKRGRPTAGMLDQLRSSAGCSDNGRRPTRRMRCALTATRARCTVGKTS